MMQAEFKSLVKGSGIRKGLRGQHRTITYVVTALDGTAQVIYYRKANGELVTVCINKCGDWLPC